MRLKKYLIGDRFKNTKGYEFEVVGYTGNSNTRLIRFDSGWEVEVITNTIKTGNIIDYLSPSVRGVGIVGIKNHHNHPLYNRWVHMLDRCYNPKSKMYKSYGAKGIIVEDYLLNFKNYIDFVSKLDNYNLLLKYPNDYQIDKDINSIGENKIYSRKTISIVKRKDNMNEMIKRRGFKISVINDKGDIVGVFDSISQCSKSMGIKNWGNIKRVINKDKKSHGFYFRSEY